MAVTMKYTRSLVSLFAVGMALTASAQTFYGGDFAGTNGLASEQNTVVSDSRVYDDFTLSSSTVVNNVFGNFLSSTSVQGLYYEIRSGVSSGNGGTLLYSGTLTATFSVTGSALGYAVVHASGSPLGVTLGPGTYWLSVGLVGDGTGRAFLAGTEGANGVGSPINNGNAFIDSPSFGSFETSTDFGSDLHDFSLGINEATSVVPGPAAVLPFALGLLARRRRKA